MRSQIPCPNSSGSGSAKLSKVFNLQLFPKRASRGFSYVWSFRGPRRSGPRLLCLTARRRLSRARQPRAGSAERARVPVPAAAPRRRRPGRSLSGGLGRLGTLQSSSLRCRWRTSRPLADTAPRRSRRTSSLTNKSAANLTLMNRLNST